MRPLTSVLLDLLRSSAAIGVVISHMASTKFAHQVPILESLGHACVAVFFVLSGYVIAWVTDTRETGAKRYVIARLSRIYSVLVPALAITSVLDYASYQLDPTFFGTIANPADTSPIHYIRSVLFLNQTYGVDYSPGTNSPIWSLGYEVPYYAMFAVLLFARGIWRVASTILLLAIIGPAVWILFPVWLMGVGLYMLIGRHPPARFTAVVAVAGIICLAAVSPVLAGLQTRLYSVDTAYAAVVNLGHSNQFIMFYTIGLFVCFLIALVDSLSGLAAGVWMSSSRLTVAYCAGSTFSIYLFHYPVLVFIYSATHYDRGNNGAVLVAFLTTISACVALSFVTEREKGVWTRLITYAFDAADQVRKS